MASVVLAARASASLARARNSSRRRSSGSLLFMMLMLMLLPLDGRQSPGFRASCLLTPCLLTLLPLIKSDKLVSTWKATRNFGFWLEPFLRPVAELWLWPTAALSRVAHPSARRGADFIPDGPSRSADPKIFA